MKLSTKLLIGLLGIFVALLTVSAFSVKANFAKINTKDPYWNFDNVSDNKAFKFIKVIGQKNAWGKVNIVENKTFGVNIAKTEKERTKVSFEGDTLVIRFVNGKSNDDSEKYQQYRDSKYIFILCPEVEKIVSYAANIEIDSLVQDKLIVEAHDITSVNFGATKIPSIKIHLGELSNGGFGNKQNYNLENFEVNVSPKATLNMRNVYPKNFLLTTTEESVVEMNGIALKAIKK